MFLIGRSLDADRLPCADHDSSARLVGKTGLQQGLKEVWGGGSEWSVTWAPTQDGEQSDVLVEDCWTNRVVWVLGKKVEVWQV